MNPIIKGHPPKKKIQMPDLSSGVNEIVRVVSELNSLKRDLENNIQESKKLRDKNEELNKENEAIQKELYSRIKEASQALLQAKRIQKGDKGDQGEKGLDADERKVIEEVLSRIKQPENGKDAVVDYDKIIAETISYFPDEKTLIKKILAKIPKPKDGKDAVLNVEEFTQNILQELEKRKPKIGDVEGLEQTLQALRSQFRQGSYIHGGGDTVTAGTNVTITTDTQGRKVISASGGGGTFTSETPTGTINGINTAFTLSSTPIANSLHLYLNGLLQTVNVDYTLVGTAITFTTAPTNEFNNAVLTALYAI